MCTRLLIPCCNGLQVCAENSMVLSKARFIGAKHLSIGLLASELCNGNRMDGSFSSSAQIQYVALRKVCKAVCSRLLSTFGNMLLLRTYNFQIVLLSENFHIQIFPMNFSLEGVSISVFPCSQEMVLNLYWKCTVCVKPLLGKPYITYLENVE